jgi:hypothetical protein
MAGATISGSISSAISAELDLISGVKNTARNSPIRHSASAVTSPKRNENQVERQKSLSVSTAR